jgi:hypothetical protein
MRGSLAAAVVLSACTFDAGRGDDRAASLFDPDRVIEVDLEIAPRDWDALRAQTRSWVDVYGSCLAEPFPNPFRYFPANLTVDGERIELVGVRKKGFLGSLSVDKPSLKIAVDQYVADQTIAETADLILNNAQQDATYVRQCLAYRTFAAAGLPAPRCNFARVRVNGDDLGLYVHVEKIDERLLARYFDRPDGNLYEGTFSDFRAGWTATFELETGDAGDRGDIEAAVAALEGPDEELLDGVDRVFDVERFLTFWATEVLVGHRDGYAGNANNFFVYRDPGTARFHFLPWGTDGTFLAGPDPLGTGVASVTAGSILPWRLYGLPAARDRYLSRLRELLDTVWDEDALAADIDHMQALITPIADPGGTRALDAELDDVRAFVRNRRAAILAELDSGPPVWSAPPHEPPCLEVIGEVAGTLETRWGTLGGDAFVDGDGTLTATVEGAPLAVVEVGALAGWDPADESRAMLRVIATLADGTAAVVVLHADPALLQPGAAIPVDAIATVGIVYRYMPSTGLTLIGVIADGVLEIAEAGTADGAPVRASFGGRLIVPPG